MVAGAEGCAGGRRPERARTLGGTVPVGGDVGHVGGRLQLVRGGCNSGHGCQLFDDHAALAGQTGRQTDSTYSVVGTGQSLLYMFTRSDLLQSGWPQRSRGCGGSGDVQSCAKADAGQRTAGPSRHTILQHYKKTQQRIPMLQGRKEGAEEESGRVLTARDVKRTTLAARS
jgi:hypothetical protein